MIIMINFRGKIIWLEDFLVFIANSALLLYLQKLMLQGMMGRRNDVGDCC